MENEMRISTVRACIPNSLNIYFQPKRERFNYMDLRRYLWYLLGVGTYLNPSFPNSGSRLW